MKQTQPVYLTIAGWLHTLLLFWGTLTFAALFAGSGRGDAIRFTASGLLLLPLAAVSWYAAAKCTNLALYLLISAACSAAFGAIGIAVSRFCHMSDYLGGLLFAALALVIFLIRACMRIKKGRLKKEFQDMPLSAIAQMNSAQMCAEDLVVTCPLDVPHPVHWAVFAAYYLAGALLKDSLCWHMAFWLFFADVFLYLLYRFSDSFHRFLTEHSRSANLPVKTMERIVRIIFVMAVVILLLFALPSIFYGREPIAEWTPEERADAPIVAELPEMAVETPSTEESVLSMLDSQDPWIPPRWLTILSDVFLYLISIGIGVGILWFIYRSCRNAGDFFASGTEDEIAFIDKGFTDESLSLRKQRRQTTRDASGSLQVRRLYKKAIRQSNGQRASQTVLMSKKAPPNRAHTPAELEDAAGLTAGGARALLHSRYEKARYSEEGCTVQEAAEVKKAIIELAKKA